MHRFYAGEPSKKKRSTPAAVHLQIYGINSNSAYFNQQAGKLLDNTTLDLIVTPEKYHSFFDEDAS